MGFYSFIQYLLHTCYVPAVGEQDPVYIVKELTILWKRQMHKYLH